MEWDGEKKERNNQSGELFFSSKSLPEGRGFGRGAQVVIATIRNELGGILHGGAE